VSSWSALLAALLSGGSLTADQTHWAMAEIMSGDATEAQIAGFVIALRAKGETPEELDGLVTAMLERSVPLPVDRDLAARAVDTCGTGGDRAHTVNISTMSALLVAATGVPVIKHGNRAATSASGSADLLEALGVRIDLTPESVARCISEVGIGFCFAPTFHPALRHASPVRSQLGVPTVFNILGPLANPARPGAQSVGVADERLAPVMAGVLARRGVSALIFRGDDGLDELTPVTTSRVWVVQDGEVSETVLDPRSLGVAPVAPQDLRGGDAAANAQVARDLLAGRRGPVRAAVLLNAAAAVAAVRPSKDPLLDRLREGWDAAETALDSGAAAKLLDAWAAASAHARG
jgi:anthranilate phosphoribosyltransferase